MRHPRRGTGLQSPRVALALGLGAGGIEALLRSGFQVAVPMLDTGWRHAGGYDSEFEFRWPPTRRVRIPGLVLTHIGLPGANWCGVGNDAAMAELKRRRAESPGVIPANEE